MVTQILEQVVTSFAFMPENLLLFIMSRIKTMSNWKIRLVSEYFDSPVPVDQVFCTRCMLCLLQSWRFQLTALPRQTIERAENAVDYFSHVFFLTCTYLH